MGLFVLIGKCLRKSIGISTCNRLGKYEVRTTVARISSFSDFRNLNQFECGLYIILYS